MSNQCIPMHKIRRATLYVNAGIQFYNKQKDPYLTPTTTFFFKFLKVVQGLKV
jgi:hypothetical protein